MTSPFDLLRVQINTTAFKGDFEVLSYKTKKVIYVPDDETVSVLLDIPP